MTIRVGLIRCDTHGMYYAPLFAKHDPLLLRQPMPVDEPMTYSWQRGANWYYFYTHYCDPKRMTVDPVDGFKLVKLWDKDRRSAEMAARVFDDRPRVCDCFEDVSDDVDLVFIADCNLEGKDHLALASPGLKKGVATFVDKPFAYTVSDVRAMFELADQYKAPIMSLSILRVIPAATRFAQRLAETGGVNFATIDGGGTGLDGLIHTISLAQHVFGAGVQTVSVSSAPNHTSVHLDYGQQPERPRHGVVIHCDVGQTSHGAMYVSACGPKEKIHSTPLGDWQYPDGAVQILKLIRQMVTTGHVPMSRHEMIECIAIAEAVRVSQTSGEPVNVDTILNEKSQVCSR